MPTDQPPIIIERVIAVPPGAKVMMTVDGKPVPGSVYSIPAGRQRIRVRIQREE